ncbi:MAG: tRNA uridine-5-carboxymethylaminomethyl(34) synthesis GTPase MnmE [Bacteroidales bacterium]
MQKKHIFVALKSTQRVIHLEQSVAAITTPLGMGGTAVIRISGKNAITIADNIFAGKTSLQEQAANTIQVGKIMSNNTCIDEVVATVFHAPHSFTGDNTVEISCHGSMYIQQKTLQLLIDNGAQLAQAGEFTLRAFLNGKIDLSQAEAIGDLIAADTPAMNQLAMRQLRGGYSEEIKKLRERLLHFASMIELELDFAEEDVEFANRTELQSLLEELIALIDRLCASFSFGNAIKKGISVAIVGSPNVGKSTLLNTLLNDEKALVTDIAGTTRDAIEDTVILQGTLFRFIDTAGIRASTDYVEQLGIERSIQKLKQAQIVLLVVDANFPLNDLKNDLQHLEQVQEETKIIVAVNKCDNLSDIEINNKLQAIQQLLTKKASILGLSAKQKLGIELLEQKLIETASLNHVQQDHIVTNARHYEAFTHALVSLKRAQDGLQVRVGEEIVAFEIRDAVQHLNSIVGEIADTDVLENIFKNFCIGK